MDSNAFKTRVASQATEFAWGHTVINNTTTSHNEANFHAQASKYGRMYICRT